MNIILSIICIFTTKTAAKSLDDYLKEDCADSNDAYSCGKWSTIRTGYCDSVHGYEVYGHKGLDDLMRVT